MTDLQKQYDDRLRADLRGRDTRLIAAVCGIPKRRIQAILDGEVPTMVERAQLGGTTVWNVPDNQTGESND